MKHFPTLTEYIKTYQKIHRLRAILREIWELWLSETIWKILIFGIVFNGLCSRLTAYFFYIEIKTFLDQKQHFSELSQLPDLFFPWNFVCQMILFILYHPKVVPVLWVNEIFSWNVKYFVKLKNIILVTCELV